MYFGDFVATAYPGIASTLLCNGDCFIEEVLISLRQASNLNLTLDKVHVPTNTFSISKYMA